MNDNKNNSEYRTANSIGIDGCGESVIEFPRKAKASAVALDGVEGLLHHVGPFGPCELAKLSKRFADDGD